jgi:hypothetical protein
VKARKVKGLDPEGPLAGNLERIIHVRLAELHDLAPRALDPREVDALHDLRIAAKRLRYLLELGAHLFGPYARPAARRAKDLQDLLGEIHDCDVMLPRVDALLAEVRQRDVRAVHERAGAADDVDPALAADLPLAASWRGLHALGAFLAARREVLFERFLGLWVELEREGLRARLEYAISERAVAVGAGTEGPRGGGSVSEGRTAAGTLQVE